MTQKELADKLNCSQQYVSLLLKGAENLTLETIAKIEEALDFRLITVSDVSETVGGYLSESDRPAYGTLNPASTSAESVAEEDGK